MSTKKRQVSKRGRKTLQRKELLLHEKMAIVQMVDMGYTHREVATEVGCCEQTVGYTMANWVPKHPEEVRVARAQALIAYARKFRGKALEALECVTKDSLTHDRDEVTDKDGNTYWRHSGPTGQQIMTAAGIAIDKAIKLDETAQVLLEEGDMSETKTAKTVETLIKSIAKLSGKLRIDVDLSNIKDTESVEAEYVDITEEDPDPLQKD